MAAGSDAPTSDRYDRVCCWYTILTLAGYCSCPDHFSNLTISMAVCQSSVQQRVIWVPWVEVHKRTIIKSASGCLLWCTVLECQHQPAARMLSRGMALPASIPCRRYEGSHCDWRCWSSRGVWSLIARRRRATLADVWWLRSFMLRDAASMRCLLRLADGVDERRRRRSGVLLLSPRRGRLMLVRWWCWWQ